MTEAEMPTIREIFFRGVTFHNLKNYFKELCLLTLILFIIVILYINYNKDNYSDSLVYFSFGLFLSVYVIATIVLIIKRNLIVDKLLENNKNHNYNSIYNSFINSYIFLIMYFSKDMDMHTRKQIIFSSHMVSIFIHILLILIVFYSVNSYIIHSKKTNYPYLSSVCYMIVFLLFNIYKIDIYNKYTKKLNLSTNEVTMLILSIFIVFIMLLYYFETIKLRQLS
jgi:hypothetical protein